MRKDFWQKDLPQNKQRRKAADARQGEKAFARGKRIVRKEWLDYFKKGKPLLEPTPYVEIIENW